MRSGTVLRVEFQRRIRDTYGEAYTPITPPTLVPLNATAWENNGTVDTSDNKVNTRTLLDIISPCKIL